MDAFSEDSATADGIDLRVLEVYPPATLTAVVAGQIASLAHGCPGFAAQLEAEPKQHDAICLIAVAGARVVGYLKLQRGRPGEIWVRQLVHHPTGGLAIVRRLFEYARSIAGRQGQLVAEIGECDACGQRQLADLALECQPPQLRTKRQRERGVYEFRSYRPPQISFQGVPRFAV